MSPAFQRHPGTGGVRGRADLRPGTKRCWRGDRASAARVLPSRGKRSALIRGPAVSAERARPAQGATEPRQQDARRHSRRAPRRATARTRSNPSSQRGRPRTRASGGPRAVDRSVRAVTAAGGESQQGGAREARPPAHQRSSRSSSCSARTVSLAVLDLIGTSPDLFLRADPDAAPRGAPNNASVPVDLSSKPSLGNTLRTWMSTILGSALTCTVVSS